MAKRGTHGGVARRIWSDASAALIRELFHEEDIEVHDIAGKFDCGADVVRKMLTGETYKGAGGPKAATDDPRLRPYRQQPKFSDEDVRRMLLAYDDAPDFALDEDEE